MSNYFHNQIQIDRIEFNLNDVMHMARGWKPSFVVYRVLTVFDRNASLDDILHANNSRKTVKTLDCCATIPNFVMKCYFCLLITTKLNYYYYYYFCYFFLSFCLYRRGDQPLLAVSASNMSAAWGWAARAFDAARPTRVIVHGFGSNCENVWVYEMRSALMAVVSVVLRVLPWLEHLEI